MTGASPTSTMSLHDELSFSLSSLDLIPEDTAWQPSRHDTESPSSLDLIPEDTAWQPSRHDTESPSGLEETDSPLDNVDTTTNQMTVSLWS